MRHSSEQAGAAERLTLSFRFATIARRWSSGNENSAPHLAPAEDFESSLQAMNESFLYSNSAPQVNAFRGIWQKAEKATRDIATANESAFVVTGPVIERDLPPFRGVSVIPKRFWKAVLVVNNSEDTAGALAIKAEVAPMLTTVSNQGANSATPAAPASSRLRATA